MSSSSSSSPSSPSEADNAIDSALLITLLRLWFVTRVASVPRRRLQPPFASRRAFLAAACDGGGRTTEAGLRLALLKRDAATVQRLTAGAVDEAGQLRDTWVRSTAVDDDLVRRWSDDCLWRDT